MESPKQGNNWRPRLAIYEKRLRCVKNSNKRGCSMKNNYALKTYMVMCYFCTVENFVQVEMRAPNKAVVGLWEFNSLSARLRRVRFPSAAPIYGRWWYLRGLICQSTQQDKLPATVRSIIALLDLHNHLIGCDVWNVRLVSRLPNNRPDGICIRFPNPLLHSS